MGEIEPETEEMNRLKIKLENAQFEAIKNGHLKLMDDYFRILTSTNFYFSQFPMFKSLFNGIELKENLLSRTVQRFTWLLKYGDNLLANKFLIRFFIELHIRARLTLLYKLYTRLELTMDPSQNDMKIKWLKQVQTGTNQFLTTLSLLPKPESDLRVIVGSLIALGAFILGISTIQNILISILSSYLTSSFFLIILVDSVVIIVWGVLFITPSIRVKNNLFTTKELAGYKRKSIEETEKDLYTCFNFVLIPIDSQFRIAADSPEFRNSFYNYLKDPKEKAVFDQILARYKE